VDEEFDATSIQKISKLEQDLAEVTSSFKAPLEANSSFEGKHSKYETEVNQVGAKSVYFKEKNHIWRPTWPTEDKS